MSSQTPIPDPAGQAPATPPGLFESPHWLYDAIMSQIEPDFMSAEVDHLDEKYEGETEAQHKERMTAYQQAFNIFEKTFKEVTGQIMEDARKFHHQAQVERSKKEQLERSQEAIDAEKRLQADSQ